MFKTYIDAIYSSLEKFFPTFLMLGNVLVEILFTLYKYGGYGKISEDPLVPKPYPNAL